MKLFFKYQWIVLISLIISGCSITKRVYQPGYHIEWKHKKVNYPSSNIDAENYNSLTHEIKLETKKNEDAFSLQTKMTPINYLEDKKTGKNTIEIIPPIITKILEKKIVSKKIKMLFSSSMKGVNLQEPGGQLFLLGILSLIFLGAGIALLYFTTPPQLNTGYICLLIGTICLISFLRILAGVFAEWAFG